ncbi:hypothetical protein [Herbidospora cretacea]|uniref:hypothetical protein n=1 Tax=Herbidospora cretacea TaxID=28444 RepID=UPI000774D37D|nr:hypothetical protein [Herbidospora cretacea]
MSVTDDNLGQLFWSAAQGEAPSAAQPKAKSSCCGPKPTAETAVTSEPAPVKSSCCGPKPAADTTTEAVPVPAAKSSCCG